MNIEYWLWSVAMPTVAMIEVISFNFPFMMECKFSRKKSIFLSMLFGACCLSLCFFVCFRLKTTPTTQLSIITLALPIFIFEYIISKYKGFRFILTYFFNNVSITAGAYLGYVICILLFTDDHYILSFPIRTIFIISIGIIVNLSTRNKYYNAIKNAESGWGIMMIVVLSDYVLMCLLSAYPTPIAERPEDAAVSVVAMILMEAMLIVLLYMINEILESQQKTLEIEQRVSQLKMAKQQYQSMVKIVEQMRNFRHDQKHYKMMIKKLCSEGEYDKLLEFVDTDSNILSREMPVYCKNYTVNIILNHYAEKAIEKDIEYKFEANVPEKIPYDDVKIVSILGNLLSNAIEACDELDATKEKKIIANITYKQNNLLIKISNTSNKPEQKNGKLISNKGENHGIGMNSVEFLVDDANGMLKWNFEQGIFQVAIVIPL